LLALESIFNAGNNPPDPVEPDKFVNGTTLNCFFFLIIIAIFTWWSWVPISKKSQTDSNQSKPESLDHSASPLNKSTKTVPTTPTSIIHEDKENLNNSQVELLSLEIGSKENIGKEVLSRTSSIEVCEQNNNNPQISPTIELEQNFADGLDQELYVT